MRHIIRLNAILWLAMGCFVMSAYGQVSGQWKISVSTPVGSDEAELELKEAEGKIEGRYSGILGQNKQLKGTCKENKPSLSFEGEWPSDGSPVEVKVTDQLSGDSGSGDVVVVNRTTGTWTARRATQPEVSKLAEPALVKTETDDRGQLDRSDDATVRFRICFKVFGLTSRASRSYGVEITRCRGRSCNS